MRMNTHVKWPAPALPLFAFLPLLPSAPLAVQDWYVDTSASNCPSGRDGTGTLADPFCRIQDAVDAAVDGETIHIAPGTYFENVLIDGKDLTLIGTGGRDVTILNGIGSGSVVRVRDTAATLTCLTLSGGTGTSYLRQRPYWYYPAYFGGGLFAYSPAGTGDLVQVLDCRITSNSATFGGGVASDANTELLLVSTSVSGNATSDHPVWYGAGGGVASLSSAAVTLLDSSVAGNVHTSSSTYCGVGGVELPGLGWGGGIAATHLILTNSTVDGNAIENHSPQCYGFGLGHGGGIYAQTLVAANSRITNNTSTLGGGVFVREQVALMNCTVAGNHAVNGGYLETAAGVHLDRHFSPPYAGTGVVSNSVFWGNREHLYGFPHPDGDQAISIYVLSNSSMTVDYSLVEEGWSFYGGWQAGPGTVSGDPHFIDPLNGDYRLQSSSPCLDAGDNTAVPAGITTDIRGFPRFVDVLLTPDTGVGPAPVVDMGAFEGGVLHPRRIRRR